MPRSMATLGTCTHRPQMPETRPTMSTFSAPSQPPSRQKRASPTMGALLSLSPQRNPGRESSQSRHRDHQPARASVNFVAARRNTLPVRSYGPSEPATMLEIAQGSRRENTRVSKERTRGRRVILCSRQRAGPIALSGRRSSRRGRETELSGRQRPTPH